MKYWWVNHKKTHSEEIEGNFIWSPETAKDGSRRETYINLTRTSPGDIIFSYANMRIGHIGVVGSAWSEQPRPSSLDQKSSSWADSGWYVPVKWLEIEPAFKPKPHIDKIWPLLTPKHYPLREDGNGVENCYLAEISGELATLLCQFCYAPAQNDPATQQLLADVEQTEILNRPNAGELEKDALVKARRGQGKFKENLRQVERKCRLTGTKDPRFLIASHIKPWAVSDDTEKLDGNNGLLLAPMSTSYSTVDTSHLQTREP